MTDIAIRVEHIGKKYHIGAHKENRNLREAVLDAVKAPFRRAGNLLRGQVSGVAGLDETIWALKDVSFEVKRGDGIGIIGRNGSGKSTLLKIISRITEPTTGFATIAGRVGSLLEVGTGFHAELTGRENIFLNGAILGMKKNQILREFDEIVAFSEVEKFIDTPVKHYSSGMYLRLAFAVAAHLDPEILVVDEVLAVGDAAFQKKCMGKMEDVAKEGRTVLFVSHNMAAIENLCEKSILIDNGCILAQGKTLSTIQYYLETVLHSVINDIPLEERKDRSGNGTLRLTSFHIEDLQGNRLMAARSGMDIVLVFGYRSTFPGLLKNVDIGFSIHDKGPLTVLYSSYVGQSFQTVPPKGEFRCFVSNFPFTSGRYTVGARVTVNGQEADWPQDAVGYLNVESGDFYRTGREGFGAAAPLLLSGEWAVQEIVL